MPARDYTAHFQELSERYNRVLHNHGYDELLIYSGTVKMQFQDDLPYPFHVGVQFRAVVPLTDAPDSWIVWRLAEKPLLLLYQPDDFWHFVPKTPETFWSPYFDIKPIKDKEQVKAYFSESTNRVFLGEVNSQIARWELGDQNPAAVITELNWYRSYKTDYEIACIQQANVSSAKGHRAAQHAFMSGASELDISLAFQHACQQDEAELAYPCVVGINQNAAVLHYLGRSKQRFSDDSRYSLLIDAGASCNGYTSDITRTYGYKKGEFTDLINALNLSQKGLVDSISTELNYFDINLSCMQRVASILNDFSIVECDPQMMLDLGIVDHFLPHPFGHFLGVQVHDVGADQASVSGDVIATKPKFPTLRMMRDVEPNQVITVEPGIYFIDSLLQILHSSKHKKYINWEKVESFKPYGGIRIEDNVLITREGPVNLTRQAFNQYDAAFRSDHV